MFFYLVIFLIAHSLQPLIGSVLARYFKGEVGEPAVFCSTMPMLYVGWNMDDCAWENLLCRLAFFLIPVASGNTYQHLPTALCGVVRVPVVTATRLKGYVEERYLTVGYFCKITVAFEIFGISGVRFANREDHLALECSLDIFAFHVLAPNLLCQIEGSPDFRPTSVEGDVGDDFYRFRAGDFCCANILSEIVVNMMNVAKAYIKAPLRVYSLIDSPNSYASCNFLLPLIVRGASTPPQNRVPARWLSG